MTHTTATDLDVARVVDEEVFWLQVSIDQVERVQVFEGQHDLRAVEARVRLAEAADSTQVREHLAAADELEHHVQIAVVLQHRHSGSATHLEREVHVHEEGEVDGLQDLLLVERVFDLLQLDDLLLVEYLHRVVDAVLLVLHEHHAAEAARAERLDAVEVVQTRRVLQSGARHGVHFNLLHDCL